MLRKQLNETKEDEMEWKEEFHEMEFFCGDGPAAYNPPKARASWAANKLISFH